MLIGSLLIEEWRIFIPCVGWLVLFVRLLDDLVGGEVALEMYSVPNSGIPIFSVLVAESILSFFCSHFLPKDPVDGLGVLILDIGLFSSLFDRDAVTYEFDENSALSICYF